jgi:hypothetical protein
MKGEVLKSLALSIGGDAWQLINSLLTRDSGKSRGKFAKTRETRIHDIKTESLDRVRLWAVDLKHQHFDISRVRGSKERTIVKS